MWYCVNMHTQRFVVRNAGDLGRTVAQARHLRGKSQTDLAGQIGIPRDYLSRLEGGMETLHLNRTLAALRALGVQLEATPDYELDDGDDDG